MMWRLTQAATGFGAFLAAIELDFVTRAVESLEPVADAELAKQIAEYNDRAERIRSSAESDGYPLG